MYVFAEADSEKEKAIKKIEKSYPYFTGGK
jgi:hypothetical protein